MEGLRFGWLVAVTCALCVSVALADSSRLKHKARESQPVPIVPPPVEPYQVGGPDTSLCGQPDTYQCSGGDCIRNDQRCNGWRWECLGNADEEDCESCTGDAFYCTSSKKCIPASYKCDNDNDCGDGQDEEGCPCDFRCDADNRCIKSSEQCNGVPNCSDGQDEDGCPCDGFKCANKACISSSSRCDGNRWDCGDNSDEKDCDSCADTGFYCPTARTCVPASYKCDFDKDCPEDGADEEGCPCPFYCEADQRCIRESAKCDGRPNCSDGADEDNCPCEGFRCADKGCVDITSRCDASSDCWDRSDELNCDECSGDAFYCPTDKKCIRASWKCDGDRNDCPLGQEDENDCPVSE